MKNYVRFLVGTAVAGAAAGMVLVLVDSVPMLGTAQAAALQLKVQDGAAKSELARGTFAPVVKKVGPSVVNIYTTKIVKTPQRMMPRYQNPLFPFFGEPDDEATPRSRSRRQQSLGSGVIVTEDGYLLTNNHVVEGADEIKVALADNKTEYVAKVVGTDPQTDLAVLKVDAKGLPAVTIADSDKLDVGDVVLAIGNPFGIGQTVTMGIVSATGRGGFGLVDYEDFIQTDASINPGNSGGALIDADGRLLGINTWIMSESGGNQGVGFAIPSNMARGVLERIVKDGRVARGYLGVMIQAVTPELAKAFNLPEGREGALVGEISPDGPASGSGLKEGDIIVEFNGKKITDNRHLRLVVSQTAPKTKSSLKVMRDGKEKSISVTLGELPGEGSLARKSDGNSGKGDTLDGVEVDDIDPTTRRQFSIPPSVTGAVVKQVDRDSACFEAGLRAGDVVVEINRERVRNAEDAVKLSEGLSGNVVMRVWQKGRFGYLVVKPRP